MSDSNSKPPVYQTHAGTLLIAGRTQPKDAAYYALNSLKKGVGPIDLAVIGGNAGQQAMKVMSIMAYMIAQEESVAKAAFVPLRFLTETKGPNGSPMMKDMAVWRLVLYTPSAN